MPLNSKDTQAQIMGQFDRGDIPIAGPLRWLQVTPAVMVLQQQWKGQISGKRIWAAVPVDNDQEIEGLVVEEAVQVVTEAPGPGQG